MLPKNVPEEAIAPRAIYELNALGGGEPSM